MFAVLIFFNIFPFYLVEINPVFNENPCTVPHEIMIKTKFED